VTFISNKVGQFTYFSQQLGRTDWSGKEVLDFGGNVGNILRDSNSTIDEARYWCIDVSKEAIEAGRTCFPKAHWIVYDRYCFFFNPYGTPKLPLPRIAQTFDYIVAYSVFTNTPPSDMLEIVEELHQMLKPGGQFAFTFIDPHHFSWPAEYQGDNLRWRLEREKGLHPDLEIDVEAITRNAKNASWFSLVNGTDLFIEREDLPACRPGQQRTCHVFHTQEFIRKSFPSARVMPPVNSEMQHCCIITA